MFWEITQFDLFSTVETRLFQQRLVNALETDSGNRVQIVSTPPVSDWSRLRWSGLRRWSHRGQKLTNLVVPLINFIGIKQLVISLGCICGALAWGLRRLGKRNALILAADIYLPHLVAAWAAARLCRLPVCAVITDMPGLLKLPDNRLKRLLRPLDSRCIVWILKRLDGLIALSALTHIDYFPDVRSLVMEGFVLPEQPSQQAPSESGDVQDCSFRVVFGGALKVAYRLDVVLSGFQELPDRRLRLLIAGKGDALAAVEEAVRRDERVKYLGFLKHEDVRQLFLSATVLVNPAPSGSTHTRYSFPSKLLEYMASGRPVISTRFPSLPKEYEPYLFLLDDESPAGFAALLRRVMSYSSAELTAFGRRAKEFVNARAGIDRQAARINQFLRATAACGGMGSGAPPG
jgi:glycosyltransferase involved in cell wall biosynthesis